MKRGSPVWYFTAGQILFYVGLICSVLLLPRGALMNNGISYYGIHWLTAIPYLVALVGGGIMGGLGGWYLPAGGKLYRIKAGLYLFGGLAIGIALTPYSISNFVYHLHTAFGSLLFAMQLVMSGWLAFGYQKNWRLIVLWLLELGAGVFSAYYIVMPTGYLFLSQVMFQMCFGGIMIRVLRRISVPEAPARAQYHRP